MLGNQQKKLYHVCKLIIGIQHVDILQSWQELIRTSVHFNTRWPSFQSSRNVSSCQMFSYTSYSIHAEVSRSAFKISAVIPSGPGALSFFCFPTVLLISSMVGVAVSTFRLNAGASGMSATSDGGGRFKRLEKYSAHLVIWSCYLVSLFLSASLMGLDDAYCFPESFLVMS